MPVPPAAEQTKARTLIRKLYEKEYAKTAAADRAALAKNLLTQARETTDDAAARYVALTESADLAAGAGDAPGAMAAIAELARHYAVQVVDLRRAALIRAGTVATAAGDCETIMRLALETADTAAASDAFDAVTQMANLAEGEANKTRQLKVIAGIQVKLADLRALAAEFGAVTAALTRLEKEPENAAAHLTVGRFYALHKGQWEKGLGHLAAGDDPELAALARRELALPEEGLGQAAVADGWWDYAEKSSGLARTVVREHATQWYQRAQETIKGITLARIQSRIEQGTPKAAAPAPAAGTSAVGGASGGSGVVDLLSLIDPAKDGAAGQWTRGAEGVMCGNSAHACLQIPYAVPEEYDLTVTFVRVEDNGAVAVLLAAGKRAFEFVLDVKGAARFEQINGKLVKDNPTVVPVAVSNGRGYTLTLEVRKAGVRAILDGKTLVEWKGDLKELSRNSDWKLGNNALCGIGANGAKVVFQAIELREVTGKGKGTR
jgi:hypothetical protein